jgi:hypothetical protein
MMLGQKYFFYPSECHPLKNEPVLWVQLFILIELLAKPMKSNGAVK